MGVAGGGDGGGGRITGDGATTGVSMVTNSAPIYPDYASYNINRPAAGVGDYGWDTGAGLLSPDSPIVRPVVYNNEFSPESTMSIANDIYREYYADNVAAQQQQNINEYQRGANRAIENVVSDRAAIQLQTQASMDAAAANTLYQQQQQLQAFQDTINARELELQNKIADYENAWQEVTQYGYVVTPNTGNLLGIEPGSQLTTLAYKSTMSAIASAVAAAEAEKVRLAQNQDELNLAWANLEESARQANLTYSTNKVTADTNSYNRLVDMLQRYDKVTPAMAELGAQVGMSLRIGDDTSNYYTAAERLANAQSRYGAGDVAGTSSYDTAVAQSAELSAIQTAIQNSGAIKDSAKFISWMDGQIEAEIPLSTILRKAQSASTKVTGLNKDWLGILSAVSGNTSEFNNLIRQYYNIKSAQSLGSTYYNLTDNIDVGARR